MERQCLDSNADLIILIGVDGCGEAGSDVGSQAVLHCEPQVLKLSLIEVGACGRNVEHSCDASCCEGLSAGRVDGTAQKQEGQQLHWTILQFKINNNHYAVCFYASYVPITCLLALLHL